MNKYVQVYGRKIIQPARHGFNDVFESLFNSNSPLDAMKCSWLHVSPSTPPCFDVSCMQTWHETQITFFQRGTNEINLILGGEFGGDEILCLDRLDYL